jgi:Na+/H+ antiporter NhaD/arsenite permease-like protein
MNHPDLDLPLWIVLPFVGLLLAIGLLPLLAEEFWLKHRNRALVAFLFAAPVVCYLAYMQWSTGKPGLHLLQEGLREYATFILLLAALYVVGGGILIEGEPRASPGTNVAILAAGAVLANLIGTTGASMVLVRPLLRINRHRQYSSHVPIFFIFVAGNLGGLLTPLGDPPLFLGFLHGVDFFWTLRLWPQWLLANGMVLMVFYFWDARTFRDEESLPDRATAGSRLRLKGRINCFLLGGVLFSVLLQSADFAREATDFLNRFFPCPDLHLNWPWAELVMAGWAGLSLLLTPRAARAGNHFSWEPIIEVAVLFAGIFVTMGPALDLLARSSQEIGLEKPWQFFWITGSISAVLDNAPTYLTVATLAAGEKQIGWLPADAPLILQAISCGAVFMGAMTYIGNGPNFMVKAIADAAGYRTPSFFRYLLYSGTILLPIFLVITFCFFV